MSTGTPRRFSVGDRVRVVTGVCNGKPSWLVGHETIIVSELVLVEGVHVHRVNEAGYVYVEPSCMVLIHDGDEPASWADCCWKPRGVTA